MSKQYDNEVRAELKKIEEDYKVRAEQSRQYLKDNMGRLARIADDYGVDVWSKNER